MFEHQCARCRYGEEACPIYRVQYKHNYAACENEVATAILGALVKNDGSCTMFKLDEAWFDKEAYQPNEAQAAYLALSDATPPSIRALVLQAAGRIA